MKFIALISLLVLSISCSSQKSQLSTINSKDVSEKLIKNSTTQAQVLENFGTPDVVEKSSEGEMWGYNRRTEETTSTSAGISRYSSAFLATWTGVDVSGGQSASATKSASLLIYFKSNKTLRTYTFRTERF